MLNPKISSICILPTLTLRLSSLASASMTPFPKYRANAGSASLGPCPLLTWYLHQIMLGPHNCIPVIAWATKLWPSSWRARAVSCFHAPHFISTNKVDPEAEWGAEFCFSLYSLGKEVMQDTSEVCRIWSTLIWKPSSHSTLKSIFSYSKSLLFSVVPKSAAPVSLRTLLEIHSQTPTQSYWIRNSGATSSPNVFLTSYPCDSHHTQVWKTPFEVY